jgi:transketolase
VIVARTVKGKGVAFAENKAFYHSEVLSQQEMAEAIPMLEREMKSLLANI